MESTGNLQQGLMSVGTECQCDVWPFAHLPSVLGIDSKF